MALLCNLIFQSATLTGAFSPVSVCAPGVYRSSCWDIIHDERRHVQLQRDGTSQLHGASVDSRDKSSAASTDPNEIVARKIIVKGDVQGGYYRSCVKNEVSYRSYSALSHPGYQDLSYNYQQAKRFRRLVGNMSPPDDSDQAEIYVEGKRKMVDGFVRWCKKADVGLSQVIKVVDVLDEQPTGLFDDFYLKVS